MTGGAKPPGLYKIRGMMVVFHLLVDGDDAWLIDTGMAPAELGPLRRLLGRLGLGAKSIRGILLTHGHFDHAGNLAELQEWTGAPVYGHPAEQQYIDGVYPYRGAARWCGRMEAVGRRAFHYRPGRIDEPLSDGDELPYDLFLGVPSSPAGPS